MLLPSGRGRIVARLQREQLGLMGADRVPVIGGRLEFVGLLKVAFMNGREI
jgi:hypothetical protein